MKLNNKSAIITGANQGLGAEIAQHFITNGASVFLCARNYDKLLKIKEELEKNLMHSAQKIYIKAADVSNQKSVDDLIKDAIEKLGKIDILVNNAGIYGPFGKIEEIDIKEWIEAVNINLMGVVYTIKAIIPHFKKHQKGKIINLSGGGATSPLPRISAYAASKAAVVRLTETIALEVKDYNIDVNSIAPGALRTELNEKLLATKKYIIGEEFYDKLSKQLENGGTPLSVGATLAVYLASDESDGISGKLISAPWDPWKNFAKIKKELQESDIYTLRRINAKDRGKDWENQK